MNFETKRNLSWKNTDTGTFSVNGEKWKNIISNKGCRGGWKKPLMMPTGTSLISPDVTRVVFVIVEVVLPVHATVVEELAHQVAQGRFTGAGSPADTH